MRKLIVANTYSQLIVALQMKNTIFLDDEIILLISNNSIGANKVQLKIDSMKIFDESYYIESKGLCINRNTLQRVKDFVDISFFNNSSYSFYLDGINNLWFDEIICYNFMIDMFAIYSKLVRINPNLEISLYEEGLLSYDISIEDTVGRQLINVFRKIQGKSIVQEHLKNFYCFYPSLYKGNLNVVKIPKILEKSKTISEIKNIFDIKKNNNSYVEKYIFFTSVYDFEGGKPIGEYNLVNKIADIVGKDNILIKQHPRDTRNIYKDNGFNVDINSAIPWEAIQLSCDFKDKVFLTVNSSSVLVASTMASLQVSTYYLYKLCNYSLNESCKKSVRNIEQLLDNDSMKDILKSIYIVENETDIL